MNTSRLAIPANLGGALQSRHSVRHRSSEILRSERWDITLRRLIFIAFCLLSATHLFAGPAVTLTWDANPEADIVGYKLSCGTSSGSYSTVIYVGPNLEAPVPNLVPGTIYYFAVSAVSSSGVQSQYSKELPYYAEPEIPSPNGWTLMYADSEDILGCSAAHAFDGNPNTIWLTTWRNNIAAPPPHEIQINLGTSQTMNGFRYLPRQDEWLSGTVGQFEFYVSSDGVNWGSPVATGTFPCSYDLKEVRFGAATGQYIRLRGLTDASGGPYMSVAELGLIQDSVPVTNRRPSSLPIVSSVPEDAALNLTLQGTDPDGNALQFFVVGPPPAGVLTGTAPQLTYTPPANFHGTDSFTFMVNDGTDDSVPSTVLINVTPVNDAPLATSQSVTTAEDTQIPITVGGTDVDADSLSFSVLAGPIHGTLTGTAPNLIYSPAANFTGADSFTFCANDGTANSAPATVFMTVTAVNDVPVAQSKSVTTAENKSLPITLTGTDVDGDPLTFTLLSGPANGTIGGAPPNLIYQAATGFTGSETITFRVNDGHADSEPATVYINVTAGNAPPIALSKSLTAVEDSPLPVMLTGTDVEGSPLTFTVLSGPANGVLVGTAPNLTYQPAANFNGNDAFTFRVNDGLANSPIATVSITVTPVNDSPLATSQSVTTVEDSQIPITVGGTDVDAENLSFSVLAGPIHGTLTGTAPNLIYSPAANFTGADSFSFCANDGTANSAPATVFMTVTAVNDVPVAQSKSVTTAENKSLPITLTGTDVDGDPLTFTLLSGPANGTIGGAPPNLIYQAATGFTGSETITFRVNDGHADSEPATVYINVTAGNAPPIALSKSLTAVEDSPLPVMLTGTDVEGSPLTFTVLSGPANGVLVGTAPNLTYQPAANFNGNDAFTFRVNDGQANSPVATVSIIVTPVNDAPLALAKSLTVAMDCPLPITLGGTDPDADSLSFTVVDGPSHGTLSGFAPNLTFSPEANFTGVTQFTFRVNDGTVNSLPATVSITVSSVNSAPVFATNPVILNATKGATFSGQLLATDGNAGEALTFLKISGPAWLTVLAGGKLGGTPLSTDVGTNSFTVSASDPSNASASAAVTITVADANEAPVFGEKPLMYSAGTEKSLYINQSLASTATDPDAGDVITYSKVAGPAWLLVAKSGVLSGSPPSGSAGTNLFTVRATDIEGAFDETTLQIKINANNLPLPWNLDRVGSGNIAGAATYSSSIFTVAGAGLIGLTDDSGTLGWQTLSGDGNITARVSKLTNTGTDTRVGVMIRESLAANSRHVFFGVDGAGNYKWSHRLATGGYVTKSSIAGKLSAKIWVRMVRSSNVITVYQSTTGTSWTKIGSSTVTLPKNCYIGLWVSSGDNGILNSSQFSNVSLTP